MTDAGGGRAATPAVTGVPGHPLPTSEFVTGPGYAAALGAAAFIDRSDRVRLEFSGPHAAATLNGLLTNNVLALTPGTGQYAAALTPKGRVIADLHVFARDDSVVVDTDARTAPALLAMLRKFVNPRFATYRDVSGETCAVGVFGPHAARLAGGIAELDADALAALPRFAHARGERGGSALHIARIPDLGVPGFELVAPAAERATIERALLDGGAARLDASDAEVLRVEAGWPRSGVDFDDARLAQEVGVDRLGGVSFDKGCYTGQETVIRVHHRGHVNRTLRGLRADRPLTPGAGLRDAEGAIVGDVRSAAASPRFGHIALAYVRREVADGVTVAAQPASVGDAASPPSPDAVSATTVPLPFA